MANFDYLKPIEELHDLYTYCKDCEVNQVGNPMMSAINARLALEWLARAIYMVRGYEVTEKTPLLELVSGSPFVDFVRNDDLMKGVHYVRKVGNKAAHTGKVKRGESFFALLNLYNFVGGVLLKMGVLKSLAPFDREQIPTGETAVMVPTKSKPPEPEDLAKVEGDKIPDEAVKSPSKAEMAKHISEAETRKLFIDIMLEEAGWEVLEEKGAVLPGKACIEVEVSGMPTASGKGYADYVLFGDDGRPLAVVEAKSTSKDAAVGRQQAILYADSLEAQYGLRPVIYYTNGFNTQVIDGMGYPDRAMYSFHSQKDLELIISRRGRDKIDASDISDSITNRKYQKEAIRSVCDHLNHKHRRALIVMATGTGKTRVAISLVEVLAKNDWVKNVLFLADRTMLVNQAHTNFAKLLPETPMGVLSEKGLENKDARILFSTYQTMINYVDGENKDFSVGRFDLIILDEAHRSIYGKYAAIFDYFDSFLVGLTATPRDEVEKNTYDLFELKDQEPNYYYEYEEAVEEGYLVPYKGYRRGSDMLKEGIKYDDLSDEEKAQLDKIWEYEKSRKLIDDPFGPRDIESREIFTYIFNKNTIDLVLEDLMEKGQHINGGDDIGKTIIFAYNHHHAEMIVQRFKFLYPEYGEDYCVLVDNTVKYAQTLKDNMEQRGHLPQIAVSVDMLDTGVDIPDILNLVFFKIVRSRIKYTQMFGRGTRLSKDIFGKGEDKKEFYIFDWGGNLERFGGDDQKEEGTKAASLTERLFDVRLDLAVGLQSQEHQDEPFEKQLHDSLKKELRKQVLQLRDSRVSVRKSWELITRFKQEESWLSVSLYDCFKLKNEVAPLLVKEQDDEAAKRFDLLCYYVEMWLIDNSLNPAKPIRGIMFLAQRLIQEKASLPSVQAKMELLQEVVKPEFWEEGNRSFELLEKVRTELRELMNALLGDYKEDFEIDIKDIAHDEGVIESDELIKTYRQRVMDYLSENMEYQPALKKIRNLEQLNQDDIQTLEHIFWEELGTKKEYEKLASERELHCGDAVGVFIRSIIGVDHEVAMKKLSEFMELADLTTRQQAFLQMIIAYVNGNGDITVKTIINKEPFREHNVVDIFGTKTKSLGDFVDEVHEVAVEWKKTGHGE